MTFTQEEGNQSRTMKPLYLIHDLVIPAGTAFHPAPAQVNRAGEGHIEATISTSGSLTYFVGPPDSPEREQMVDLFSETAPTPEPTMTNKECAVKSTKVYRKNLDVILQEMKAFKGLLIDATRGPAQNCAEDPGETIAQLTLSTRDLESAIMRLGMTLKNIGNPDPYPESRNPASPKVEPTADGLKL